jgi:hypothetical protein
MKLGKWIIGGAAMCAAAIGLCTAGTFTNHGIVGTSSTLAEYAVTTEDLGVIDDYSEYPRYQGRHGTIIRIYNFDTFGGSAATYALDMGNTRKYISDNTIIWDGFIDVTKAVLPTNATVSLGINTTTDILAATTNLQAICKLQIIPVGTVATLVQATNNLSFTTTFAVAPTQGVFVVYMDAYLGQ